VTALEALYDHFSAGDGTNLVYFPIFNYNDGNLGPVHEMLHHPRALAGLSDAGAHVGTVCDASFSTFMLTHWARDRARRRRGDAGAGCRWPPWCRCSRHATPTTWASPTAAASRRASAPTST
jgi:hypothetical protein